MRTILLLFLLILTSCLDERQRSNPAFSTNNPSANGSRYPSLFTPDGKTLYMSWLSGIDENLSALEYAVYEQGLWYMPRTVYVGGDLFPEGSAPAGVVPLEEGVAAHWLRQTNRTAERPGTELQVSFPSGGERQWNHVSIPSSAAPPPSDETRTAAVIPATEESVLVLHGDTTTLRAAVVHSSGRVEREHKISDRLCDTAVTDLTRVQEKAYAVWEECLSGGNRQILVAPFFFASGEWGPPSIVFSTETGSGAISPSITAGADRVVVVWVRTGDETEPGVLASFSRDGAETFEDPVRIGEGPVTGQADVVLAPDNTLRAVWYRTEERMARIFLQAFSDEGRMGDPVTLGTTGRGEVSGSPVLAAMDDGVFLAWTQTEPFIQVRTAFYGYPVSHEPAD